MKEILMIIPFMIIFVLAMVYAGFLWVLERFGVEV